MYIKPCPVCKKYPPINEPFKKVCNCEIGTVAAPPPPRCKIKRYEVSIRFRKIN